MRLGTGRIWTDGDGVWRVRQRDGNDWVEWHNWNAKRWRQNGREFCQPSRNGWDFWNDQRERHGIDLWNER